MRRSDVHAELVDVVDEDRVTGPGIGREPRVGRRHPFPRARHVIDGDPHGVAGMPLHRAVGEPAEPDLGSLQVGEDADGASGLVGDRTDGPVRGLVI
jgi:hypothetical protein